MKVAKLIELSFQLSKNIHEQNTIGIISYNDNLFFNGKVFCYFIYERFGLTA